MIILTIMASAHRHAVDEWAYLRDVLERLARGDANLDDLWPDNWKQAHPEKVRTFRAQEREQHAAMRSIARAARRQAKLAATPASQSLPLSRPPHGNHAAGRLVTAGAQGWR